MKNDDQISRFQFSSDVVKLTLLKVSVPEYLLKVSVPDVGNSLAFQLFSIVYILQIVMKLHLTAGTI